MTIFLIGFMGSGKSLIGQELAALMKYKFLDTDSLIETKRKKSIAKLFATEGEEYFREIERKTLLSLKKARNTVIATGGGMPCYFENMQWMNSNGVTVYLDSSIGF